MDDDTHLKVGDPGHSYKCVSEQVIYFSNQSSFYMNMTIKNVQLQAFHVQNSSYSPGKEYTFPRCIFVFLHRWWFQAAIGWQPGTDTLNVLTTYKL